MEGGGEAIAGDGAITSKIEVTSGDAIGAVTVNIRRPNATKFSVQVSLDSSVEYFKSVIANNCDVPAEQQLLLYNASLLKNDRTLESYGMEAEHTVHLVGGLYSKFFRAVQKLSRSDDSSSSTPQDPERELQRLLGQLPKTTTPQDLERIVQLLFQNPNLTPQTMNQLMNNPDALHSRIVGTPKLCDVIDTRPEFGRIFSYRDVFRDLAAAVVYFELIREGKRYIDRAGGVAAGGGGGHEIGEAERSSDSDYEKLSRLTENPYLMTIQILLTNPDTTNPELKKLMEYSSLSKHLVDLESMQQLMELQQSHFSQHGEPEKKDTDWEWDFNPNNSNVGPEEL